MAYNQYSEEHPWHGAGQGTRDADPQWIVQTHSLITMYHHEAKLLTMQNPIMHKIMTMGLDAFMDDTTHLIGNDTHHLLSSIIPDAQANVDLWQGLIIASSGTLNPSKCILDPISVEL